MAINVRSVPFLDLSRNSVCDRRNAEQAIARVLDRGLYTLGPELESLEREFADFLGAPFAAGVASGTDALTLALEASGALEPGKDQEVITTAISAAFTALAIYRAGASPRFVDVDPVTLQMDPSRIEPCITERTRAIVPVHLFGHACDIFPILELAQSNRLAVIEDACQAHGSRLGGKALGTFSRAAAFSFYPTKNMGAFGDAGMVLSHDESLIRKVKMLRHGGQDSPYPHELLGCCSRLDEIQAAILRLKLQNLEECNDVRRSIACRYDAAFSDLDLVRLPPLPDFIPNRHLYPVRTTRRNELRQFLAECGIQTLIHYPAPLTALPAFRRFVLPGQEFPVAAQASREILSLPLYPALEEEEIKQIIQAVRRFFKA
jgi:dTDP-4-amino-4,6-dideoxygalactose transaminase